MRHSFFFLLLLITSCSSDSSKLFVIKQNGVNNISVESLYIYFNEKKIGETYLLQDPYYFYNFGRYSVKSTDPYFIPISTSSKYLEAVNKKQTPDIESLNFFLKNYYSLGDTLSGSDIVKLLENTQVFGKPKCGSHYEFDAMKGRLFYNISFDYLKSSTEGFKAVFKKNRSELVTQFSYKETLLEMKKNNVENPELLIDKGIENYMNRFDSFLNLIDSLSQVQPKPHEYFFVTIEDAPPHPIFKFTIEYKNHIPFVKKEVLNPKVFYYGYLCY